MPNLEKDRHTETIRKSSFKPVESDQFQIGPCNRRFRSDAYGALSIDWTTYDHSRPVPAQSRLGLPI